MEGDAGLDSADEEVFRRAAAGALSELEVISGLSAKLLTEHLDWVLSNHLPMKSKAGRLVIESEFIAAGCVEKLVLLEEMRIAENEARGAGDVMRATTESSLRLRMLRTDFFLDILTGG